MQLLGPYLWKRGGFDRIQNDAASALGIPRFRYRSSEIDLAKVDEKQREFLSAPEIIATGFEDFKAHLEKELAVLAQRRKPRRTSTVTKTLPRTLSSRSALLTRTDCGTRFTGGFTIRKKSIPPS